ncbi:UvrD-helicase domain-containing protein [Virgibacillus salinus]|uniref:UvrD-like helicase C-terminal domain-containing protein n=1 Tax=Virgibacillus salinus TaxID=553311 RepID=A0A1H1GHM2_9BACI|nr:UvrD-helicase domain-containing protein [Virgibacillus salinus]SDR12398.1 UvrD-like helicase C-terminal domain-containing protein [Virgibacillus salinus]
MGLFDFFFKRKQEEVRIDKELNEIKKGQSDKFLSYLPRRTYQYFELWHEEMSLKKDYINIISNIQSGRDSLLSDRENELLIKLFSTNIISRQNIAEYCFRFNDIQSEDVLWNKIIEYLERYDYRSADQEYYKYVDFLQKEEYVDLKNSYREESAWTRINSCLKSGKITKADLIWGNHKDIIPEKKYEIAKEKNAEHIRTLQKGAIFDIIAYLEGQDVKAAEKIYYKFRDIITEADYAEAKQEAQKQLKNSVLKKIKRNVERRDIQKAEQIYSRFKNIITNNDYEEAKQAAQKRVKDSTLKRIAKNLENQDIKNAEQIHSDFQDLITNKEYNELLRQYGKNIKIPILNKIKVLLDDFQTEAAEQEYLKFRKIVTEKEYHKVKIESQVKIKSNAWQRIRDYLGKNEFEMAENEYNKHKDIIPKSEYLKEKLNYSKQIESSVWNQIIDKFEQFNLIAAEDLYNKFQYIINKEKYVKEKQKCELAKCLLDEIINHLRQYNFKKADELANQNNVFTTLQKEIYKKYKVDYLKDYFFESYIEDGKPFKLDEQQSAAVASSNQNTLVSARAGSGKTRTIVAKILYLLEKEQLPRDSVYVFAFNKNVPVEISQRIQNQIRLRNNSQKYSEVDVAHTFHKVALKWAKPEGKVLAENKRIFIKLIIDHLKQSDPNFAARVYKLFRNESMKVERTQFKDPEAYYTFIRNKKYFTLNGEIVKSLGEKWIADFLFEHGIDYRYEYSFYPGYINPSEIKESEKDKQTCKAILKNMTSEIKPDFYLIKEKVVWEHWGIDEKETNEISKKEFGQIFETSWQDYRSKMQVKRDFWGVWRKSLNSKHWAIKSIRDVNKLIETSVSDLDYNRETFELHLIELLKAENITVIKRNQNELIQEVWEKVISKFVFMIESFINRYQQRFFDSGLLFNDQIEKYHDDERIYEFLKLGQEVLQLYECQLNQANKISSLKHYEQYRIDFNQLILEAIKKIENGNINEDILKIKYILIDEYQDFSELFFRLINSIRSKNPNVNFFCVGDDWQAINRFAGSDVEYFHKFNSYFANAIVKEISTNYRSSEEIISKSNKFMYESLFDGSPAKAFRKGTGFNVDIKEVDDVYIELREGNDFFLRDKIYIEQFISGNGVKENEYQIKARYLKKCVEIIKEYPKKKILILHRNNYFKFKGLEQFFNKLIKVLVKLQIIKSEKECKERVTIKTMHASKGLESDVVILLEINQGIIPMFHPDTELFKIFGEEIENNLDDQRRLFYVAMTRAKENLYILTEKEKRSDFLKLL